MQLPAAGGGDNPGQGYVTDIVLPHPAIEYYTPELPDLDFLSGAERESLKKKLGLKTDHDLMRFLSNRENTVQFVQQCVEDCMALSLKEDTMTRVERAETADKMQRKIRAINEVRDAAVRGQERQLETAFTEYQKAQLGMEENKIDIQEPSRQLWDFVRLFTKSPVFDADEIMSDTFARNEVAWLAKIEYVNQYVKALVEAWEKEDLELDRSLDRIYREFYANDIQLNTQQLDVFRLQDLADGREYNCDFNLPFTVQQVPELQKVEAADQCFEIFEMDWE